MSMNNHNFHKNIFWQHPNISQRSLIRRKKKKMHAFSLELLSKANTATQSGYKGNRFIFNLFAPLSNNPFMPGFK